MASEKLELNPPSLSEAFPDLYENLRILARAQLRRERHGHTLQTTALAHEAYIRLASQYKLDTNNRANFFIAASNVIRRVLVEHARARVRHKRGGAAKRLALANLDIVDPRSSRSFDYCEIDDALDRFAKLNRRAAQVVELRFFGGLSIDETAESLGISPRSVKSDWTFARAWLWRDLQNQDKARKARP